MKRRPTQADVAQLAGVSRAVVSYVVNDVGNSQVSPPTRQRVLDAINQLGYQPDALAQSLRSGSTNTIGLLIPDMDNPHYWHITKGVEQVAQQSGYDLLLISSALDLDRELHGIRALSRRRVDGLILILSYFDQVRDGIQQLAQGQKPIVLFNAGIDGVDHVCIEAEAGTKAVMDHLLALGHRRLGFVYGVANRQLAPERLHIFRHKLQQAGIVDVERYIVYCGTELDDGYQAALRLLQPESRPTALLVINDLLAIGALRAAADLGLAVPGDVSVASFDDINLALHVIPRLTTVGIDATGPGQLAAQMLLRRIADPLLPPQMDTIASQLIVRDSTGPVNK